MNTRPYCFKQNQKMCISLRGFRFNGGVCVIDIHQEKLIPNYQVEAFSDTRMNVGCFSS